MKIWIDITNTPHVNVLMPIIRHLEKEGHELILTARDFSETIPLLRKNGIIPIVYGKHNGKNKFKKIIGMLSRIWLLLIKLPEFDLAFSLGGNYTSTIAWIRRKKSISFTDNDFSHNKILTFLFSSYFIFPCYYNYKRIQKKYHLKDDQIKMFDGFKEDIYIADYKRDEHFLSQLPFKEFITIRPENLKAAYVPSNSVTIVPQLFELFKDRNILFLPRYEEEKKYAEGYDNIWYPSGPLSGLDVCYYTKAMLTGAGSFAREAALLGVPAVSFFPGKEFLSVDKILQEKGLEFKSRDPFQIKEFVDNILVDRSPVLNDRSEKVLKEVLNIIDEICLSVKK